MFFEYFSFDTNRNYQTLLLSFTHILPAAELFFQTDNDWESQWDYRTTMQKLIEQSVSLLSIVLRDMKIDGCYETFIIFKFMPSPTKIHSIQCPNWCEWKITNDDYNAKSLPICSLKRTFIKD